MNREENKQRCNALLRKYSKWLLDEYNRWGAYEITYMPGWFEILEELFSSIDSTLTPEQSEAFHITQIKEKFGALRFYYDGQALRIDIQTKDGHESYELENSKKPFEMINELISKAAQASVETCMFCGDPGVMRTGGWYTVLCDHHNDLTRQGKRFDSDFELMTTPARRH